MSAFFAWGRPEFVAQRMDYSSLNSGHPKHMSISKSLEPVNILLFGKIIFEGSGDDIVLITQLDPKSIYKNLYKRQKRRQG